MKRNTPRASLAARHSREPARRPAARQALRRAAVETLEHRRLLSLTPAVGYAVGNSPQGVVTADFNGDDVLDLATANSGDSTVSVLLGKGDGTFADAVDSTTATGAGAGIGPRSLAVGDFDGDLEADDVATINNNDVSILLGNGDGTLSVTDTASLPAVTVPGHADALAQSPLSVAVGDVTGDGKIDLTVTGATSFTTKYGPYYGYYGYPYYRYSTHNDGHVNVLIGDGLGGVTPPAASAVQLLAGSYPISAVLDDLDGDAGLDLAVADYYGARVHVLSGNNDGTFDAPVDYATGWSPTLLVTGDFDGNNVSDLAVASYYGVDVLLGNGTGGVGDGTFQAAQNTAPGFWLTSLATGDFDSDGMLDLVATSNYYSYYSGSEARVNVLLGNGTGTFGAPRITAIANGFLIAVATGEFDDDLFSDAAVVDPLTATLSVLLNDQFWPPTPPPSIAVDDVTLIEGNTGSADATFTVTLSSVSDVDVTVHYATADDSAAAGSDYTDTEGDVTIPAGQLSGTFTVPVTGDRVAEASESFTVTLSDAVNATIGDVQGVGTIVDDEPRVSVGDVSVTEGNSGSVNATFTASLSAVSDVGVTVHYATANDSATAGSDYTAKSGDVTIPAGSLSATFFVAVTGDRVGESTEGFFVNLTAPVNGGISDAQGVGSIVDNEPRITINDVSKKEGNGGTTQLVFTVRLSAAYDQAVMVSYATASGTATAGSDYQTKSGTLTFASGVTSMTFSIVVLTDKTKESNETFVVNLSGASGNSLVSDVQGIGTILDDDTHGKR